MKVSVYWLGQATGKHPNTIKKRLADVHADPRGKYDSADALEAIYVGGFVEKNGEFVSTPEAVRQLTIAKRQEIDLTMEIQRGKRVPIEDCLAIDNEVFQTIAGTIKANRGKILNDTVTNEMFDTLRDWAGRLNGNGH